MSPAARVPADRIVLKCDERRETVLELIRSARTRLTLSLFRCTDKKFFAALKAAVDRGVQVDVLMTPRAKGGRKKLQRMWDRLEATGATIASYNDPVVKYHAKYMVVDDGPALIASLNFTRKCFTRTSDAILLTYDPAVVSSLRAVMAADRDGRPLPEGLTDRLILGPERARRQFTALIEGATTSVQVLDPKLSDPGILSLLNARREAGVRVEVFDGGYVGAQKSHGKMLLVDGRQAVIGSMALTALCLDFRREVAVAVTDPAAVSVIREWFGTINAAMGAPPGAATSTAGGATC